MGGVGEGAASLPQVAGVAGAHLLLRISLLKFGLSLKKAQKKEKKKEKGHLSLPTFNYQKLKQKIKPCEGKALGRCCKLNQFK